MKYLPLVLRHLSRERLRSFSTVLALALCVFLFCTLQSVIAAVNWGLETSSARRLVARNAVSVVFPLPLTYERKIAAVPGVRAVALRNWFGGYYRDPKNFFTNVAVDPEPYLKMYPELILGDEQKRAFVADRRGAVIGPGLARRFGWKLGDSFQMSSTLPYYRVGGAYEFVVRGIYAIDPARYPGTNDSAMLFHFDYLSEKADFHSAGMYVIEIDEPERAGDVAARIDALFENSKVGTRTETEAAFRADMVSLSGNLALLLNGIGVAVAFGILLVTANTMSMSVRERRTEIAVLKTLGFSNARVTGLVLAEAGLLGAFGGGLGVLLGRAFVRVLPGVPVLGDALRAYPHLGVSPSIALAGLAAAVLLSLAAGSVPSLFAFRAPIAETLRPLG